MTRNHLKSRLARTRRNSRNIANRSRKRAERVIAVNAVNRHTVYDGKLVELTNTLTPMDIYAIVYQLTGDCLMATFNLFIEGEVLEDVRGRGSRQRKHV